MEWKLGNLRKVRGFAATQFVAMLARVSDYCALVGDAVSDLAKRCLKSGSGFP